MNRVMIFLASSTDWKITIKMYVENQYETLFLTYNSLKLRFYSSVPFFLWDFI